jgi:hypothetical protein
LGKSVTPPMCTSKLKVVEEAEKTRVEGHSDRRARRAARVPGAAGRGEDVDGCLRRVRHVDR